MLLILHNKLGLIERLLLGFNYNPLSIKEDQLDLVAVAETNILDEAWNWTQNCWPQAENAVARLAPQRSTDVGDIIQTESGESYLVDSSGFTLLEKQPIYAHVSQVVQYPTGEQGELFPTLSVKDWASLPLIETQRFSHSFYYLEIRNNFGQTLRLLRIYK
ncbi:hypothetical protein [Gloeothece verrucosa]|uniref:Uncharacterized protein n=1 Tax=Gloeothece verrucosa (strain PCC 7822) TaxID=497965 RepID=E0UMQ9_GLOV7|nr:hypothetical protein [Gloeothece verrucosa]ADN18239.1 hypothetical protein Cyan7822_6456 [Gloeothece verrucosa PCC 7822]